MYADRASTQKYTSVVLTLLLHALLIGIFFYEYREEFKLSRDLFEQKEQELLTPQEERERAELIQRGGAPVHFQDMPEYKQEMTNAITYNPVKPQDDAPMPTQPPPQEQQEPLQQSKPKEEQPKGSTKQATPQAPEPKQHPQTATKQTTPTLAYNAQTHKTTATRANINPGDGTKNASKRTKQLTFADILEGFNNMLKSGNNDWMSQTGKKGKDPDYQDLKAMSYMQKLSNQLRGAWDMGIDATVQRKFVRGMHNFKFALSIAKDGDILDLQVAQSTGIPDIDAILLSIIRSSSPFPPVPDHLKMQVFSMVYELMWG